MGPIATAALLEEISELGVIPSETPAEIRYALHHRAQTNREPGILGLQCATCSYTAKINADDRPISLIEAQGRGWEFRKGGKAICPICPK